MFFSWVSVCVSLSVPLDIKMFQHGGGFLYASVNESVCGHSF